MENRESKSIEFVLPSCHEVWDVFFDEIKSANSSKEIQQFINYWRLYWQDKIYKKPLPKGFDNEWFIDHIKEILGVYLLHKAKAIHSSKPNISEHKALHTLISKYAQWIWEQNISFTKNLIVNIFEFSDKNSLKWKRNYKAVLKKATDLLTRTLNVPASAKIHSWQQIEFFPLWIPNSYPLVSLSTKSELNTYIDILQLKIKQKFDGSNMQYFDLLDQYTNYLRLTLDKNNFLEELPTFGNRYNLVAKHTKSWYSAVPVSDSMGVQQEWEDKLLQYFLTNVYINTNPSFPWVSEAEKDLSKVSNIDFLKELLDAEDSIILQKKKIKKDKVNINKIMSKEQVSAVADRAIQNFKLAGWFENDWLADFLEELQSNNTFTNQECQIIPSFEETKAEGWEQSSIGWLFLELFESEVKTDPAYLDDNQSLDSTMCITSPVWWLLRLTLRETIDESWNASYLCRIFNKQSNVTILHYSLIQDGKHCLSKTWLPHSYDIINKHLSNTNQNNPALTFWAYESIMSHVNSVWTWKRPAELVTLFKKFRFVDLPSWITTAFSYELPDVKIDSKKTWEIDQYFFNNIPSCPPSRILKNISWIPLSSSYLVSFSPKEIRINFVKDLVEWRASVHDFIQNINDQKKQLSENPLHGLESVFNQLNKVEMQLWNNGIQDISEQLQSNINQIDENGNDNKVYNEVAKGLVDEAKTFLEDAVDNPNKDLFYTNYWDRKEKLDDKRKEIKSSINVLYTQRRIYAHSASELKKLNAWISKWEAKYQLLSLCMKRIPTKIARFKQNTWIFVNYYRFPPLEKEYAKTLLNQSDGSPDTLQKSLLANVDLLLDEMIDELCVGNPIQLSDEELTWLKEELKISFEGKIQELIVSQEKFLFFDMRHTQISSAVNMWFQRAIVEQIKSIRRSLKESESHQKVQKYIEIKKWIIAKQLQVINVKIMERKIETKAKISLVPKRWKWRKRSLELKSLTENVNKFSEKINKVIYAKRLTRMLQNKFSQIGQLCKWLDKMNKDQSQEYVRIMHDIIEYDKLQHNSLEKTDLKKMQLKSLNTHIAYLQDKKIHKKHWKPNNEISTVITKSIEVLLYNKEKLDEYSLELKSAKKTYKNEYDVLYSERMEYEKSNSKKYQKLHNWRTELEEKLKDPLLKKGLLYNQSHLEAAIPVIQANKRNISLDEAEREHLLADYEWLVQYEKYKFFLFKNKSKHQANVLKMKNLLAWWYKLVVTRPQLDNFYDTSLNFASFLSNDAEDQESLINDLNMTPEIFEKMYRQGDLAKSIAILKESWLPLDNLLESAFQRITHSQDWVWPQLDVSTRVSKISTFKWKISWLRMYKVLDALGLLQYVLEKKFQWRQEIHDLYEKILEAIPWWEEKIIEIIATHSQFLHEMNLKRVSDKLLG